MNASGQEPAPAKQTPRVFAPEDRMPKKPVQATVPVDVPHDEHGHDEPGYGHGV